MVFGLGLPQPYSSIYLITLWLATLKRPSRVPGTACRAGDDSDPPKNRGVMRSQKAGICNMPLFDRMTGRYRLIYPCGKAWNRPPFPSRFIVSDRSSPSRVRFAASRPGLLPGRSERRAAHEGKGGGSGRGVRGQVASPLAHDKGYYHSYTEGADAPSPPRSKHDRSPRNLPIDDSCEDAKRKA